MKTPVHRRTKGFTLIELTLAMSIGMATATMLLALFNQQLAFLNIFKSQNFLTEEAPIISMYVNRLVGKADSFSLHETFDSAKAGTNARPAGVETQFLALSFRQADGITRRTILAFQAFSNVPALYYYVVPTTPPANFGEAAPEWAITKAPKNVTFSMNQGVLRMVLTGPKNERITYSGTMQQ